MEERLLLDEPGPVTPMRRHAHSKCGVDERVRGGERPLVIERGDFAPSKLFEQAPCLDPLFHVIARSIGSHWWSFQNTRFGLPSSWQRLLEAPERKHAVPEATQAGGRPSTCSRW